MDTPKLEYNFNDNWLEISIANNVIFMILMVILSYVCLLGDV